MSEYLAPLKDMRFVLNELAGLDQIGAPPGCEEASPGVVDAILEEAAKLSNGVMSSLNRAVDLKHVRLNEAVVNRVRVGNEA